MSALEIRFDWDGCWTLILEVRGYKYPRAVDVHDRNWVGSTASVSGGKFRGECEWSLFAADFEEFRDGLRALLERSEGTARLEGLEPEARLEVTAEHPKAPRVQGFVRGNSWGSIAIAFDFETDLPTLRRTLAQVEAVVAAWPPR